MEPCIYLTAPYYLKTAVYAGRERKNLLPFYWEKLLSLIHQKKFCLVDFVCYIFRRTDGNLI